jgi:hypothetical protein
MRCKYYYPLKKDHEPRTYTSDICIYGATASGIVAAVEAARSGKKVNLVEFSRFIGGMTTSGLSATDIGDKDAIGGITLEFHKELGKVYGTEEHWFFEPHVALSIFRDWLERYKVNLYREQRLKNLEISPERRITGLITENGDIFRASVYIDATYEGDLMAAAGVSYTSGRESNEVYGEAFSGVHLGSPHHNFTRFVDPYRIPGDIYSGVLPGICTYSPGVNGEGDDLIQAYNFRLCLTKKDNRVPFPKPANYDKFRYALAERYINMGIFDIFDLTVPLPGGKADHNNWGAVNTDNIGKSQGWPEGSYEERQEIYQDHLDYQQGLFWFLLNDESLPKRVRTMTAKWGLAPDEFTDTDNWPPQLYVREARRMISDYVLTESDVLGKNQIEDSVGMGSFKMDSHNCKRVIKNGRAINEGNIEVAIPAPYSIPYRALRPKRTECVNLIVSVCISASHVAFCSMRMESTFMVLGQSAAAAAALAIDKADAVVQNISYSDLYNKLISGNQYLREAEVGAEEYEREGKRVRAGEPPIDIRRISR